MILMVTVWAGVVITLAYHTSSFLGTGAWAAAGLAAGLLLWLLFLRSCAHFSEMKIVLTCSEPKQHGVFIQIQNHQILENLPMLDHKV